MKMLRTISSTAHRVYCKLMAELHNVFLGTVPLVIDKHLLIALLTLVIMLAIFAIQLLLFRKGDNIEIDLS